MPGTVAGRPGRFWAGTVELWSDTRFTDAHRLEERLGYRRTGETRELGDLSNTTGFRYLREFPADADRWLSVVFPASW